MVLRRRPVLTAAQHDQISHKLQKGCIGHDIIGEHEGAKKAGCKEFGPFSADGSSQGLGTSQHLDLGRQAVTDKDYVPGGVQKRVPSKSFGLDGCKFIWDNFPLVKHGSITFRYIFSLLCRSMWSLHRTLLFGDIFVGGPSLLVDTYL